MYQEKYSIFECGFHSFLGAMWFRKLLMCLQLSNSGNPLKLLILNHNRKIMPGLTNFLVIIQMIFERKMGNRGSKSIILVSGIRALLRIDQLFGLQSKSIIVKEQRVNDYWSGVYTPRLRCTLMGFERNSRVRIRGGLSTLD